ncbi:protein lev-9-like [Penaeus chinensis]|uniref:protein lev-9-like n=1 Tax=Penaeus chinensis TaxID=139456 RepID=UPI001FB7AEC1|nr:protein lev-9-like [Penaeus chinensis]
MRKPSGFNTAFVRPCFTPVLLFPSPEALTLSLHIGHCYSLNLIKISPIYNSLLSPFIYVTPFIHLLNPLPFLLPSTGSEGGVGGRRSHFADVSFPSNPYTFLNDDELVEGRKIYKNPRNAPSDSCPKDEDAVARAGRTCLRKCSTDADCLSRKKVCLCDGICGMSCIKPDKECSDLDNPGFGYVDVKGKVVGSQANYRCQEGYHLIGQTIRLCQANGIWSSTPPECHENLYCTDPPAIPNARHSGLTGQTRFEVNQTLKYSCYEGYTTQGFDVAKCFLYNNTMQWFGPEIKCIREWLSVGTITVFFII